MARLSYPDHYERAAERHGLTQDQWDLIVNFYDNAAEIIEDLESTGDLTTMWLPSFRGDDLGLPTWVETEEDGNTYGRLMTVTPFSAERAADVDPLAVMTAKRTGQADAAIASLGEPFGDGVDLILRLAASARKYGAQIAVEHRVVDLVMDDGAVVGVVAETSDGPVTISARRGVVFGSGGMEHNQELRERFLRGPIVGSCGTGTNRGDFITIGERYGTALANTREAWWAQLPLEPCLESFEQGELMGTNYGDSMIVVSAEGKRVVNEKQTYNERGKIHSEQAADGSYPNRLLVQIFDEALIQDQTDWPSRWPTPKAPDIPSYVLRGETLAELTDAVTTRLAELADRTDGFALDPGFLENLEASVERFNRFARSGTDWDFGRGATWVQRYFSVDYREDPMPNFTMYPIAETGPYYAIIIGASCLGTKGGPKINTRSQVVREDGTPIAGLYGAGNCIGSPTGEAYWGGGSTLGPAIVHGYLAGKNVAHEPARVPAAQPAAG